MRRATVALLLGCLAAAGCVCYSHKPLASLEHADNLDDTLAPIERQCASGAEPGSSLAVCERDGKRWVWLSAHHHVAEDELSAWDADGGKLVFSRTRYWSDTCLLPPEVHSYGDKPRCVPARFVPACAGLEAVRAARGPK